MSGPGARAALGHQFTDVADEDVEGILKQSGKRFGPRQRDIYAGLIDRAAEMVMEDPERPGATGGISAQVSARSIWNSRPAAAAPRPTSSTTCAVGSTTAEKA